MMNYEEYCEWVKEHANKEEVESCAVVDVILKEHLENRWLANDYNVSFEPRKVLILDTGGGKERIEFDLLITLKSKSNKILKTISVEFKEWDIQKVIWQALRRLSFVDYAYIATRESPLPPLISIVMAYAGIGWVVWSDKEHRAFLVWRATMKYASSRTGEWLLQSLVDVKWEKMMNKVVEEKLEKKGTPVRTLFDFESEGVMP